VKRITTTIWQPRAATLWLFGVLLYGSLAGQATWSPGNSPDPQAILTEAEDDTAAGRYAIALAKHVWFYENALKYAPAMYGVRLSFALSSWRTLADSYPPALEKLKSERNVAADNVRAAKDARHSFHDFAAINQVLAEDMKTRELFLWLDASSAETAASVYDIAQPSLVRGKKYQVCGKYLDPNRSLEQMIRLYRGSLKMTTDPEYQQEMRNFAEKSLSNGVGTLIALLVVNGRASEANRIAHEAERVTDDPAFRKQLASALKGEVPVPWP
jgi:hypothetical protein